MSSSKLLPFAFNVSCVALACFAVIEWRIPGFVSLVFPFYILAIIPVALFALSFFVKRDKKTREEKIATVLAAGIFGGVVAALIAHDGAVFGFMKLPLAFTVFLLSVTIALQEAEVKLKR